MNLDYFKDFYFKFKANYDLSDKWSIQPGIIYHKRSAVDKTGFEQANRPTEYYSFAPSLQIQFRPYGWNGPIFTTDYERGVKMYLTQIWNMNALSSMLHGKTIPFSESNFS